MAKKLTSMKLSAKEQKAQTEPSASIEDRPRYPWGLTVTLDREALDKLGIDDMPEVDEEYVLVAKVAVTSVSSNASQGGKNRSLGLQITEMCLEDADSAKDAAAELYGEKKK